MCRHCAGIRDRCLAGIVPEDVDGRGEAGRAVSSFMIEPEHATSVRYAPVSPSFPRTVVSCSCEGKAIVGIWESKFLSCKSARYSLPLVLS